MPGTIYDLVCTNCEIEQPGFIGQKCNDPKCKGKLSPMLSDSQWDPPEEDSSAELNGSPEPDRRKFKIWGPRIAEYEQRKRRKRK